MQEDQRFYINQLARQNTEENVSHLLSLLFSSILSPFVPAKNNSQAPLNHRTKYTGTVEDFLQKNAYKKIHLCDLAEILSLSEKQCARLLKKHYGCTLSDLIHKSRMENAAVMLKYTDLPINEIAHRLGYEYENYFYTVFRKHYSITPFEYRARALKEMEEAESKSGADNT
jgi:AraC-like DNA-binding protein